MSRFSRDGLLTIWLGLHRLTASGKRTANGGHGGPPTSIFISHKHDDFEIARALASWLQVATRNGVEVFRSSDGFRDGPALGRSLTEEIRNKAHEAAAMFVLYTDAEQDWEWVMFEIGIGLDPSTPETRVVLIQCGAGSLAGAAGAAKSGRAGSQ